jgi:hypothetical protein
MSERRFHKGDLVRFQLGTRSVQGQVREDRGPIGVRGRHLYLVEFHSERQSDSLALIELPAEHRQAVPDTVPME